MARFKVTHSDDACCIDIRGDVRNPEPSTAVVKFPGGHIEVSRHSDGSYWVHVARNAAINDAENDTLGEIVESRIDYTHDAWVRHGMVIPPMPAAEDIQHLAIRIARRSTAPAAAPTLFDLDEVEAAA